jgi:hypothetical protein
LPGVLAIIIHPALIVDFKTSSAFRLQISVEEIVPRAVPRFSQDGPSLRPQFQIPYFQRLKLRNSRKC